jgi:hypothetical protein
MASLRFARAKVAALTFLTLGCVLTAAPDVLAAQTTVGQRSSFDTTVTPFTGITLSEQQRLAIRNDWAVRKPAFTAITGSPGSARRLTESDRAALRALVEARNAAVRAILTPQQNLQLDQNLSRITEQRRTRTVAGTTGSR